MTLTTKFDQWDRIVDPSVRKELEQRLAANNHDPKKAFSDTAKNPLPEHLKKIVIYKYEFVVRYNLDTNFKAADAAFIVDERIKALVKERLNQYDNNPKEAFKNLTEKPIWLHEEKQIPVKAVRCFTGLTDLTPLHSNSKGEPVDFVSTRNNHHIAIYKDKEGMLQENAVTFWDALERKRYGLPIVIKHPAAIWDQILANGFDRQAILEKLPKDDWEFVTSLSQNEMFVFGYSIDELQSLSSIKDYQRISTQLFRIQKIATKNYCFRHHLESSTDDKKNGGELLSKQTGKLIIIQSLNAFKERSPIKVRLNSLGQIVKIGE